MKIAHKLPLFVVAFGAVMAAIVVSISTITSQNSARTQAQEHFESLVASRKAAVESLMRGITADLLTLAAVPSTGTALQRLSGAWTNLGDEAAQTVRDAYITNNPNPLGERHLLDRGKQTIPYNIHHAKFHPAFRTLLTSKGYYDAFLVNLSGNVLYSVYKEDDYATNLYDGPYKDSGLAQLFRRTADAQPGEVLFSDFAPYEPSQGKPAAFVATQIVANTGQTVGILVLQMPVSMISAIMNEARGIGETADAYLVASDLLARSSSRFEGGHMLLDPIAEQEHITSALNGESKFYPSTTGLNGREVSAFSEPIALAGKEMAIVIEQDRAELMAHVNSARNFLLLVSLACTAGMSLLGWLYARTITRPLDRISSNMESVASGNLETEVSEAKRVDEIGQIGKTLVSMQDDLRHARTAQEERAQQQQEQQRVVETLSSGLLRLAQGDFSEKITEPFTGEHEQLRSDFNKTVENLSDTVSKVVESASSIRNGAAEISQSSDDLSHRTESQAATLEETAAALDELTASVKSAAEGARSVENIMDEAKQEAENSGVVVQSAVSAMTEIEQSSTHIAQIISVIDDIAFQTNLLALNAGVEAARAGEAGRGFAVVASEVRALAQRSSDAAMEIKTLIGDSSKQVERGVDLVGKAGEALQNIVQRVNHISKLVTDIAEGAAEQSTGLGEINTGVVQLDQVTQQNAAMVEEATAAGHMLNSDATKLAELVAHFKITGGGNITAMPQPSAPIAPTAHGEDDWDLDEITPTPVAATDGNAAIDKWQDF